MDGSALEVTPDRLDAEGRLKREHVRIGTPRAENCAVCHGVIAVKDGPLAIPEDFERPAAAGRTWSLTMAEGAIVSPQRRSDSFLNLEGKADHATPWDVHTAKLVDCVACHYSSNNPAHSDSKVGTLRYLKDDPRRQSTADYLVRPDHRLARHECRSCHEPMKAHEFLPYRARHMAALACQACHLAAPMAPAVEMIDATVVTLQGTPAIRYRNVDRRPGEGLNTASIRPFQPLLVERTEGDGITRLGPVNPVSRFRWVSGVDHTEVPFAKVAAAFLDGDQYARAILDNFDANKNAQLEPEELRLDSKLKTELIAWRLAAAGVAQPTIVGTIETHALTHGVPTRDQALRDCEACHASDSRISEPFTIAGYLPGGQPPTPSEGSRVNLVGLIAPGKDGGLALKRESGATPGGLHVLGLTRDSLSNTLGFWLFVAVFLGVTAHGLFRIALRRHRAPVEHLDGPKAYVFGRYERIWHWTMALAGVVLIVTGLEVHNAGAPWFFSLPRAVALHNVFAVVLIINAALALFYHLTTWSIRNFIPEPNGFLARVLEHMTYQSRGIFFGGPHPSNAPGHKLNPLQQVTYLALLNLLFPLQVVTGALIWAAGNWPSVAAALGGLRYLAPLHAFGSWLFLSFFVLHVYLVTTGRHPVEHLESMITGYQALEHGESTP
jgi:thiosulfate reductase cytochrome b subunit